MSLVLDALFTGGRFRTLAPARPTAHTVGVIGERIVGLDDDVAHLPARRTFDLGGAPALPGFHDAHHHLSGRGKALICLDVTPAVAPTLDALYAAVAARAATLGEGEWLIGGGYADSVLGAHPRRAPLDAAAGGRPCYLQHASGHGGVLNSEGIRRISGDSDRLADVPNGFVERTEDGRPTGFIAERAVEPLNALIRPTPLAEFVHGIGLASRAALADGLTSITEPGIAGQLVGNGPGDLAAYQAARDQGLLGVRATVMPEFAALHPVEGAEPDQPGFGLDLGLRTGLGDTWLRLGPVKIFSDGALTSLTAALTCPYAHAATTGVMHQGPEALARQIMQAHLAGWQIATHAIGDLAVTAVIDAYEAALAAAPRPDSRHRIEHCGMADDATVARIAALGLIPVPQGEFLTVYGDQYIEAIGVDRAQILYRQLAFLEAGLTVPGSSDCPVVGGSPLAGIQALVERIAPSGAVIGPDERLTVAQAVTAYTAGSAYAERSEADKGAIVPGKLADFVVLTDDLWQIPPDRIAGVQVQATVVGGSFGHGEENVAEA